jgi:[ribosomal protein S5]-alanine N-acetyltransferase
MRIDCGPCALRGLRESDAESLVANANDRDIWLMLRDRFPHPYLPEHAREFIQHASTQDPPIQLAITVDDHVAGMIGFIPGTDIERVNAEIGYWLGKAYWGRGIATAAIAAATQYAIRQLSLTRVFAIPFVHNAGSIRVLEKVGYIREGLMKQSAIKDGVVHDQYLYAYYA